MYRIALVLVTLGYLTFLPALPGGTIPASVRGDLGPEMDPDGVQLRLGPEIDPNGVPQKVGPEVNPDG